MVRFRDLKGQKFNKLLVLENTNKTKNNSFIWKCMCDCGNIKEVTSNHLTRNQIKSCGCLSLGPKPIDMEGRKLGKLLIQSKNIRTDKHYNVYWNCLCDCGKKCVVSGTCLRSKNTRSCGCIKREEASNRTWRGCGEVSATLFCRTKNSARIRNIEFNITIEDMWNQYLKQGGKCNISGENITLIKKGNIKDIANQTASLDRIDSKKGYTVDNIQWVHKIIQRMKMDIVQDTFIKWSGIIYLNNKERVDDLIRNGKPN